MDERITELEGRIAFQAQTIDALHEEVLFLAKRLERLEQQLSGLARNLREERPDVGPHDVKPPHY